jgi:hypothetical protein
MSHSSKYLVKASQTQDPLERLKLVAANWFSGIHIGISEVGKMAPINPILGETMQRELPDGTTFIAE